MLEKRKRAIENEKEREMKRKHLKNNVQSLHSIVSTVKFLLYAKKTRRRSRRIALILHLRNREQTKQPKPTDDDEKEGRTRRKYNNKKNK